MAFGQRSDRAALRFVRPPYLETLPLPAATQSRNPASSSSDPYSASLLALAPDSAATSMVRSSINANLVPEKSLLSTFWLTSSTPWVGKASKQLRRILRQLSSLQL